MARIELQSHFVGGMLLVTDVSPGALEPVLTKALAEVDPNLTIVSVRTLQQQVDAVVRPGARGGEPRGAVRDRGAAAGGRGAVRRDGLHGGAADGRDGHPDGARRRPPRRWWRSCSRRRSGAWRSAWRSACRWPSAPGGSSPSQLYGVSFWDPLALALAVASLGACAFVAAIIPAGRAASISPMNALRTE